MGVKNASVFSNTIVNASIATTVETIVVTTPPINQPLDGALVLLFATVYVNPIGAAASTILIRFRRGPLVTSPLVNVGVLGTTVTAGGIVAPSAAYFDAPGAVAGQQYSLTVQFQLATGNSTIVDVFLAAIVL